jgi:YesN/AraC family two-component response regulator
MDKKSLLLVDDDEFIRDIIKASLEKEYNIFEASKYSDVLGLSGSHIDLAIIDYALPDSDGFEVLKTLRKTNPTLPAIIMTGYSDEDVVIKAIRATVADYIKKPLSLAYLRMRISEILGGKEFNMPIRDVEEKDDFILDGIALHIKEHYMKDLTLDKLARMACMSRFRFCRSFKERFGQSFVSYINGIRANNAAELLKNTDLNIAEIAFHVGFKSAGHFCRVFKTVHKTSPSEFRKRVTGRNG